MVEGHKLYWDSCVFIAYLNDEKDAYGTIINDIGQYLNDAKLGKCTIYCSTISIAEVIPKYLKNTAHTKFIDFLRDYSSCIVQIGADPIVMGIAADLKSLPYKFGSANRRLMTPDAIHLATVLTLKDAYNVEIDAFHTFDKGKAKGPEGKGIPLLGFEKWCEGIEADPLAKRVIDMKREQPNHPSPTII